MRRCLGLSVAIALAGVAISGCGGAGSTPKQTAIPLCNPASAPAAPPAIFPDQIGGPLPPIPAQLSEGCARGLAHDVVPAPLFRCTGRMGPAEIQTGPSSTTNLDRVELHRGSGGLCVELSSGAINSFTIHQEPEMVLRIDFYRGRTPPRDDEPSKEYEVSLWALDAGYDFWLTLYPPHGEALETAVGNVGVAAGNVSLIVRDPRLPSWVLAPGTNWDAKLV